MIKTGSDFSGVGAFDQALSRLGIEQEKMFACDMDKYARQTYILNYGEPKYYPENVYDREIPKESLDIYMTSPPCQGFSLAGKREGSILFFNSLEFIEKNRPRYFIFENVKGLLSHDKVDKSAEYGRTFQEWINHLGGKSINGVHNFFPIEDSVPYHIYFQVMNAKHYGVPQNRERIFIIGIRDDADNEFSFPKPFHLIKRLKDVLETEVDEKYFLSDKMISWLNGHSEKSKQNGNGFNFKPKDIEKEANSINARVFKMGVDDNYIEINDGLDHFLDPEGIGRSLRCSTGRSLTKKHSYDMIMIPANNSKGYDIAEEEEEDSINFSNPNSETRRGRVGKGVAQTLDTACNQGVLVSDKTVIYDLTNDFSENKTREYEDYSPSLRSERSGLATNYNQRIRRLTPLECFRLMDFNEDFKWNVSDSQAYKQAGNSIVVACLEQIIKKLF